MDTKGYLSKHYGFRAFFFEGTDGGVGKKDIKK